MNGEDICERKPTVYRLTGFADVFTKASVILRP